MEQQTQSTTDTATPRLEDIQAVCQRTGMGKSYIYREVAAGNFPKPIKISNRSLFVAADVSQWINERIAENKQA